MLNESEDVISTFCLLLTSTGEHNLDRLEGYEQNITVERIIKHPKYDAYSNHDYDVALMKLKTPIKYNSHVRPVCLATSDFDAGTNCFVTGWGHTSEGGNIARVNIELSS